MAVPFETDIIFFNPSVADFKRVYVKAAGEWKQPASYRLSTMGRETRKNQNDPISKVSYFQLDIPIFIFFIIKNEPCKESFSATINAALIALPSNCNDKI